MSVKQVKVGVNELTVGMFVSGLDRPWTQTPFPLQGFYLRELDEIKELKVHCKHVFIDVAKGAGPVVSKLQSLSKPGRDSGSRVARTSKVKIDVAPLKVRRHQYPSKQPLKKEVTQARVLHQRVFGAIGEVIKQLDGGAALPVQETKRVAGEMVDSVLRNPDALTWLARVKELDEHTFSHSLRSAVWAIIFGRHVGLGKRDLDTLAMGVLFKDVGKLKLPKALLSLAKRTPAQEREFEQFVGHGVALLRASGEIEPRVIAVVKGHCERVNGSGFPSQLKGDKIPLLAKIAGIVTFYDEVTNPRGEKYPLSPSKAVAELYACRDREFQEELVVEFIRGIGLYPTGTLVALNTGEVAVVVEQNFERRLKPQVLVVLDVYKQQMSKPLLLDLAEDDKRKQALVDSGKKRLEDVDKIEITQDLEAGSYEIDVAKIRDQYLFKEEKKSIFAMFKRSKD